MFNYYHIAASIFRKGSGKVWLLIIAIVFIIFYLGITYGNERRLIIAIYAITVTFGMMMIIETIFRINEMFKGK